MDLEYQKTINYQGHFQNLDPDPEKRRHWKLWALEKQDLEKREKQLDNEKRLEDYIIWFY